MKDRFACPRRDLSVLTNIGEALMDSNKINIMKMLNCDEKYKSGSASDYELLAEWERVLPLCEGSGAAALYEAECKWLGIADLPLHEKWKQGNKVLAETDFSEYSLPEDQIRLDRFVMNFVKRAEDKSMSLSSLVSALRQEVESLENQEIHLVCVLPDVPFQAPNPYAAEQALSRLMCDEKNKEEDLCLLLTQLVISLCLDSPKNKKLPLHLCGVGDYGTALAFLSYLNDRRLFAGELYFGIFLDTAARVYERLCAHTSERILLHPELVLTVPDFGAGLPERLAALFRLYPKGAVSLGGVLTDSPLSFIGFRALHSAL